MATADVIDCKELVTDRSGGSDGSAVAASLPCQDTFESTLPQVHLTWFLEIGWWVLSEPHLPTFGVLTGVAYRNVFSDGSRV